jgi:hypothetical protein
MNTFFLSLIQPDKRKREKNLCVEYQIVVPLEFSTRKKEERYIKSRFPFLTRGDKIEFQVCNRHGIHCSFFYNGVDQSHKIENLSSNNESLVINRELTRKEKLKIQNTKTDIVSLKNVVTTETFRTHHIPSLKIGRRKYQVFLFLDCFWDEIPFKTLYTSTTPLYTSSRLNSDLNFKKRIMYIYSG